MQRIAMQYMSWQSSLHHLPYRNPHTITTNFTHLQSTKTQGIQLRELSQGFLPLDSSRIIVTIIKRRRGLIAVANLGGQGEIKSSGTSARERRLEKLREERKRREHEKKKNVYPEWAKILEDACKDDVELREIIGDAIGNADLMKQRIEERVRRKGRDFLQPKTGSVVATKVVFRDFNPTDSYIWIELYAAPTDKDLDFIGRTIRSWYVLGRLGGFNSTNLQLTELGVNEKLSYSLAQASKALPSSFHDISNVEFQDNLGRFWVDMGTADVLALDILINALLGLNSDYVGIKQLVFGGARFGDWEQGMTSVEYGYKVYKI